MTDKKQALQASYKLLVMLGEISGEMLLGGKPATKEEIDELCGYANEVYDFLFKENFKKD